MFLLIGHPIVHNTHEVKLYIYIVDMIKISNLSLPCLVFRVCINFIISKTIYKPNKFIFFCSMVNSWKTIIVRSRIKMIQQVPDDLLMSHHPYVFYPHILLIYIYVAFALTEWIYQLYVIVIIKMIIMVKTKIINLYISCVIYNWLISKLINAITYFYF